jgi:Putative adhesin
MSWLYTIVFAGLFFSPQAGTLSDAAGTSQDRTLVTGSLKPDESEHFEQTYPLNADGRFCLSNVNGSIIVDSWDRNEVKVEYTKVADSKEHLADVEVRIDPRPDYVKVETDYGDWKKDRGGWRTNNKLVVDFHITAPRGAVLNEIETVNGSVSVSKFTNYIKVSAVNGAVSAANLRGTAVLSTVNGDVSADYDKLESGNKINLNTVNGSARIVIPSDSNATFKVDSLNGNISNDFGLPVRKGKYVGRDLYGKVGTGDVSIKLSSVNGPLTISRKNDGKTPGPVVNLLPQKKEDDDWDNDNDEDAAVVVDSEKLNKEITKSVKTAQKEVVRIQPEIARIAAEAAETGVRTAAQTLNSEELKQKIKDAVARQKDLVMITPAPFMSSVPKVEKKSESFPVKGVPRVTVDAKGCSVSVKGWDKSEVQYRVVQFSDARHPSPLNITDEHTDTTVNIQVREPSGGAPNPSFFEGVPNVRIEIYVPRKTDLKIETDAGIRLEGVSGDVDLLGENESINVRDVDGKLHAASSDGRIRVVGFKGDINAETSDGMISLEGDFQKLSAHADNAPITLTLPATTQADLEANCPDVQSEGIALIKMNSDEKHSRYRYRIGNGGLPFSVETAGEIQVRGASVLTAGI